jgi:hypothetical protein
MSHTIPPLDELKRKAYCMWHNLFSHATNDCNVFHRHVQSVINEERLGINEERLSLKEMQVDKNPFPVNCHTQFFKPKSSTHHIYEPGSIVPHI